jgi:hypothetical protein
MMARSLAVAVLLAVSTRACAYVGDEIGYGGQETCIDGYDVDCHGSKASLASLVPSPQNKWPAKEIAGTVGAAGVAATGLGLLIASTVHQAHEDVGRIPVAVTTAKVSAPAPTPSPVILVNPMSAGPGQPAVGVAMKVESVPVAAAAASRLLGESAPKRQTFLANLLPIKQTAANVQSVEVDVPVGVLVNAPSSAVNTTTMAAPEAQRTLLSLFACIAICTLCLGCFCSFIAAHCGGYGKKRNKRRSASQDQQQGYAQPYINVGQ